MRYCKYLKFCSLYSALFGLRILVSMHLFLKLLSRIANNVDPDHTAPSGAV